MTTDLWPLPIVSCLKTPFKSELYRYGHLWNFDAMSFLWFMRSQRFRGRRFTWCSWFLIPESKNHAFAFFLASITELVWSLRRTNHPPNGNQGDYYFEIYTNELRWSDSLSIERQPLPDKKKIDGTADVDYNLVALDCERDEEWIRCILRIHL